MTLWDIIALHVRTWLREHKPHRVVMMRAWPSMSKPRRTNIVQRWAMRRAIELAVVGLVFRVNPLHPVTLALTVVTGTLVFAERGKHREKEVAIWGKPSRSEWR